MSVTTEAKESEDGAAPQPSMLQTLLGLWRELPGLISDRIDLLALEVRRAGRALMQIAALVVVASMLAVTAWLALWSAVVGLLVLLGLHWSLALLVVLVMNLAAAWWAVARIRSLVPALRLPATRRHMALTPAPGSGEEPAGAASPPTPSSSSAPTYASNATHAVAPEGR